MSDTTILKARLQTCIDDYKKDNRKFPNAIVLSPQARQRLAEVGLIRGSLFDATCNEERRSALCIEGLELPVYSARELSPQKQTYTESHIAHSPQAIFLGRQNWRGNVKGKTLCMYNLEADLR